MTEQYNYIENTGNTYFNHILLDSEVRKLTKSEDFDPRDLTVELKINGEVVRISDFNEVLEDWGERISGQIKHKVEYLSKEKTVVANAETLLKEKLGKAYEILQEIEDSSWKLGDDQ